MKKRVHQALRYFAVDTINAFFNNSMLAEKPELVESLLKLLPEFSQLEWLYKASVDGWGANTFHQKCDTKPNTVTLVRVGEYIFGGYTPIAWHQNGSYSYDANSFLFSLSNPTNDCCGVKFPNTGPQTKYSIYGSSGYGPTFGGGHDFHISDNANSNNSSYSNFGHGFAHPSISYNSTQAKNFFCGSYNFRPSEVEVFQLQ